MANMDDQGLPATPPPAPPPAPTDKGAEPAEGDELSPEEGHQAMRFAKHMCKHHPVWQHAAAQYEKSMADGGGADQYGAGAGGMAAGAGAAAPGGGNTFVPSGGGAGDAAANPPKKPDEEPLRMERDADLTMRYAHLTISDAEKAEQLKAQAHEIQSLRQEMLAIHYEKKQVKAQAKFDELDRLGYALDKEFVTELCENPEDKWDKMVNRVTQYHRNHKNGAPIGERIGTAELNGSGRKQQYSDEINKKALQYCKDKGLYGDGAYKKALEEVAKESVA
jgi:hypothetical protein